MSSTIANGCAKQTQIPNWMSTPDKKARRAEKLARVAKAFGPGKIIPAERTVEFLETILAPGERLVHEGDNQKLGDFLAEQLAQMDPKKVHGL
jgi:malonate decarboxylase alpha subunit